MSNAVLAGGTVCDQVCVFFVTYYNACGYFFVVSRGTPLHLPVAAGEIVSLFFLDPTPTSDNHGIALVRIGTTTLYVFSQYQSIPVSDVNATGIGIPAHQVCRVKPIDSNMSLGDGRGQDLDLDKVLLLDPVPRDTRKWLQDLCVGGDEVALAPADVDRSAWSFVIDACCIADNIGVMTLRPSYDSTVSIDRRPWASVKMLYRN